VNNSEVNPQCAEAAERREEHFLLFLSLLAMNCGRENSRRSEMRENPSQAEMLALRELAGKAIHISGSDTQTIHARVNLQVELDGLGGAARRPRNGGSGALEK